MAASREKSGVIYSHTKGNKKYAQNWEEIFGKKTKAKNKTEKEDTSSTDKI